MRPAQFTINGKTIKFKTNMTVNELQMAADSWSYRTKKYNYDSFAEYVNSKNSGHIVKPI